MSRKNKKRQIRVKKLRQKVRKRPMAERALAVRRPEEIRRPGKIGKTRKPVPAAGNLERREKQERQRELQKAR